MKALIASIVSEEGATLLGWRDVPTDNSLVGDSARATQPIFEQLFIGLPDASFVRGAETSVPHRAMALRLFLRASRHLRTPWLDGLVPRTACE